MAGEVLILRFIVRLNCTADLLARNSKSAITCNMKKPMDIEKTD